MHNKNVWRNSGETTGAAELSKVASTAAVAKLVLAELWEFVKSHVKVCVARIGLP